MTAGPADAPLTPDEAAPLFAPLAGRHLLVGWSGGPDSTALLGLLALWAQQGHARLQAATVDHGLRAGSRQEAEWVHQQARIHAIPHRILTWQGDKPQTGLQEAARAARYRLLAEEAERIGADAIVTAHTLDDQAETILMRLSRGSGLEGLRGMRPVTTRDGLALLRPLLAIPKARLVATCAARNWACISDPLNADPRFARARWRRLMPLLAAEGLTAERLALMAGRIGAADDALLAEAVVLADAGSAGEGPIDLTAFAHRPVVLLTRWLMHRLRDNPAQQPPPLARCEALAARLHLALQHRKRLRATLDGRMLTLDRKGCLQIQTEPPRTRDRT